MPRRTTHHLYINISDKLSAFTYFTMSRSNKHAVGVLLRLMWILTATHAKDTLQSCLDSPALQPSEVSADKVDSKELTGRQVVTLYKSSLPVTWCQALHACRALDESLASLPEKQQQEDALFPGNSHINITWVAGRRKDAGKNWTWVGRELKDFHSNETEAANITWSPESDGDAGAVLFVTPGRLKLSDAKVQSAKPLCAVDTQPGDIIPEVTEWFAAQKYCATHAGVRLATLDEILERRETISRGVQNYWVGLYRRPWIWVNSSPEGFRPVVYSSWRNGSLSKDGGDCLGLVGTTWRSRPCQYKTRMFICQSETQPMISLSIYTFSAMGGLALMIILLACCILCKGTRTRRHSPENTLPIQETAPMTSHTDDFIGTSSARAQTRRAHVTSPVMVEMKSKLDTQEQDVLYYESIRDSRIYS